SDLPLNNADKLVVEMDLNPTDKTIVVLMYKLAKFQDIDAMAGSGKGQVISFRLKDPEDGDKPFFAANSVYKNFSFEDFALLARNVGVYREDVSDRALVLRSVEFGSPNILKMAILFPTIPNQADFTISHIDTFDSKAELTLFVQLPS